MNKQKKWFFFILKHLKQISNFLCICSYTQEPTRRSFDGPDEG